MSTDMKNGHIIFSCPSIKYASLLHLKKVMDTSFFCKNLDVHQLSLIFNGFRVYGHENVDL
jgi:hypothetical protein